MIFIEGANYQNESVQWDLMRKLSTKIWYAIIPNSKGQLNSEWIYEVIVSPKMPTKNQGFLPYPLNKLPGQKSLKYLVGILGETMTF